MRLNKLVVCILLLPVFLVCETSALDVFTFGQNASGQFGLGSSEPRYSPTRSTIPDIAIDVAMGLGHLVYLRSDGSATVCGMNNFGQLGLGDTSPRMNFYALNSVTGVKQIACGYFHTLLLKDNGRVYAFGNNSLGQLGLGNYVASYLTPVEVPSVSGQVIGIRAGGHHSAFLMADGTVRVCGYGFYGQLGNGSTANSHTPTQLGIAGVVDVALGGYHTVIVKSSGIVQVTGRNEYGQLGLGHYTSPVSNLTQITSFTGVKSAAAGDYHSLYLKSNGNLWITGRNNVGQLGMGAGGNRNTPGRIPWPTYVQSVYAGGSHSFAVMDKGVAFGWGDNTYGQLGYDPSFLPTTSMSSPVFIRSLMGIKSMACSPGCSSALVPRVAPVPNDWDGDGSSDLIIYDESTGDWYVRNRYGWVEAWGESWGWAGAIPVPGDYDGDRRADKAVFGDGNWFIQSSTGEVIVWNENWGWPGAIPVAGDYDGDGIYDLAVFDNNTGLWYVKSLYGDVLVWGESWGWPGARVIGATH